MVSPTAGLEVGRNSLRTLVWSGISEREVLIPRQGFASSWAKVRLEFLAHTP